MIKQDIKHSPFAAEDAAIAMMESMAPKLTQITNKNKPQPFSYFKKVIVLLKQKMK